MSPRKRGNRSSCGIDFIAIIGLFVVPTAARCETAHDRPNDAVVFVDLIEDQNTDNSYYHDRNKRSVNRLRKQQKTKFYVEYSQQFAATRGDPFQAILPSRFLNEPFADSGGFQLSATRLDDSDSGQGWGWNSGVLNLEGAQTLTAVYQSWNIARLPGDPLVSGLIDSKGYTSDMVRIEVNRVLRNSTDRGHRVWFFGMVAANHQDSTDHSLTSYSNFGTIGQPSLITGTSPQPNEVSSENWMIGPQVGIDQTWEFWNRFELGYGGRIGGLYNYARHQSGRFLFPFSSLNPDLFASQGLQRAPSATNETHHQLSAMADAEVHLAWNYSDLGRMIVAVRHVQFENQSTVLSETPSADTRMTLFELWCALSY